MSNDLISRSAVMDYLREQQANVIIEKNKNGFVNTDVCDGMSSAICAFMNFIMMLPAAYDVDKVVEQLRSEQRRWKDSGEEYEDKREIGVSEGFEKAIEIIRRETDE